MKVFVVYSHPSRNSFTCQVKDAFLEGLAEAGDAPCLRVIGEVQKPYGLSPSEINDYYM